MMDISRDSRLHNELGGRSMVLEFIYLITDLHRLAVVFLNMFPYVYLLTPHFLLLVVCV